MINDQIYNWYRCFRIEQAALNTKLARLNGNFWMDLKRDKFGRFVWSNGQDHIPFTNWGSGQPSVFSVLLSS